jgi:hypothetical protein
MTSPIKRLRDGILLAVFLSVAMASARAEDTDPDGARFDTSDDAVADVRAAMERASDANRRVLVVLGANWCHDSRALAARVNKAPLDEVIEDNYELVFVDVGYLDKGRAVLDEFGVAQFYATPTVLIVDPTTGQVVNDEDRHMWGAAYSISMSRSVDYFETWATKAPPADPAADSPALQALYAEIDRFEDQLAERVAAGYTVVGPMLKQHKDGDTPRKFRASWDELRDFRTAIPGDVAELREEARQGVAEGEEVVELEYPEYAPLSWEAE